MGINRFNKAILLFFLVISAGCKKLVTVPPPVTQLSSENVFTNNSTAASVLTGIYTEMANGPAVPTNGEGIDNIFLFCGVSSDELTLDGGSANGSVNLAQFYVNALTAGSPTSQTPTIFSNCYNFLYTVNLTIEKLSGSTGLTPVLKQQLTGEALFMRAFLYFYLVNLYGDVPLTTSSDYTGNAGIAKSPQAAVYEQIISDLKTSQGLLGDGYVASDAMTTTTERVRPNKWAATALLSRVYLYNHSYDSAELEATAILNNTAMYDTVSLNGVFLKNSIEAIWQLQPVNTGMNTNDAWVFILPSTGPTSVGSLHPVYLSPGLLGSFEVGDERRYDWVDSVTVNGSVYYFPYKYKSATLNTPVTEYQMILRLGEQYLIRAEARALQNEVSGAQSDLNVIRGRAGLPGTLANTQASLLTAIAHERQVELFTEWGHRWLDLKRNSQIDAVMGSPGNVCSQKGGTWNTNWQWYPLPAYDIIQDPQLTQNEGY
jgi:starch-binding outer membrane protein, SusD/RagB family